MNEDNLPVANLKRDRSNYAHDLAERRSQIERHLDQIEGERRAVRRIEVAISALDAAIAKLEEPTKCRD